MPELPDIVVYIEALEQRILNRTLAQVQLGSPFLLRTALPPINTVEGQKVIELRRLGKRICIGLENDLWLVLHLMIAGRLHWKDGRVEVKRSGKASPKGRNNLATFHFANGTLSLTEAGTQRRASLHLVEGETGLQNLDPGGLEVFATDQAAFAKVLKSANHTLKRALTDPRLFSGIGNAYSDEILWAAQLSPVKLTQKLTDEEIGRLFDSTRSTLTEWIERSRGIAVSTGSDSDRGAPDQITPIPFPEKVTAFRPGMAVHGKYGQSCPRCGNKIQRIRYAANETNYCPSCQTGGKLLADRALSRLLRADWPKNLDELEGLTSR
ncbi:MAG: formamidopyrimidine-DNA glycosylase [Blastocatellia bacterium]|jgi:formamidopyrimidine-DNA glycosylase|nr:formamidopyrimidine-DNA glycosylase [Blastocatellia bacterium]